METKICKKCGIEKELNEFQKYNSKGKVLYRSDCKECHHKKCKEWEEKHKEQRKEYRKEYRKKHNEELKLKQKEKFKKYGKEITQKRKPYQDAYREKNKERLSIKRKEYYEKNKEKILKQQKEKRKSKKYKEYHSTYISNRIKKDKKFAMIVRVRKLLFRSFNEHNIIKNEKALKIISCDFEYFYNHLLKTFESNYKHEWDGKEPVHIDHIIPLATAKTEEDIIKLCHYTNLQLLKAKDNLQKGKKINYKI